MIRNENNTVTLNDSEFKALLSQVLLLARLNGGTLTWHTDVHLDESQLAPIPLRSLNHLGYRLLGDIHNGNHHTYKFAITCGQRKLTCFVAERATGEFLGGEVADFLVVKDYGSHYAMVKYDDLPGLREYILGK